MTENMNSRGSSVFPNVPEHLKKSSVGFDDDSEACGLPFRSRRSTLPPTHPPCWETDRERFDEHTHLTHTQPLHTVVVWSRKLVGCPSMNYEFHSFHQRRRWHGVLINQCIIIRNSWSSVDVFICGARLHIRLIWLHQSTGGSRSAAKQGNKIQPLFCFSSSMSKTKQPSASFYAHKCGAEEFQIFGFTVWPSVHF